MNTRIARKHLSEITERLLRPPWSSWKGSDHIAEICRGSVNLQVWPKEHFLTARPAHYFTIGRFETDGQELWVSDKLRFSDVEDAVKVLKYARERFRQIEDRDY